MKHKEQTRQKGVQIHSIEWHRLHDERKPVVLHDGHQVGIGRQCAENRSKQVKLTLLWSHNEAPDGGCQQGSAPTSQDSASKCKKRGDNATLHFKNYVGELNAILEQARTRKQE